MCTLERFVPTRNTSPHFGEAATPHVGFPSHVMTAPAMIDQPVPGVVNPLTSSPLDVVTDDVLLHNWINSPISEEQCKEISCSSPQFVLRLVLASSNTHLVRVSPCP